MYRKHAHTHSRTGLCDGSRMAGTAGSKVVWFHVRRVQRLPSLHAVHEIPKVQVSRVSRGDALLTVCRGNASYFSFFFLPTSSVANYTWGMRNVCRMREKRPNRISFRVLFVFVSERWSKTRTKKIVKKIKRKLKRLVSRRRNTTFVHGKLWVCDCKWKFRTRGREKFRNPL